MTPKSTSDDSALSRHTRGVPMGRVRPATLEEDAAPDTMFRPDAVLALTGAIPADLSPFEMHVANLVDGFRPVARIRKKSGVSSADLRIALGGLHERKLLRVTGIVEEAIGEVAIDISQMAGDGNTNPNAPRDVIPPHVMSEIQAMLDEEADDDDE